MWSLQGLLEPKRLQGGGPGKDVLLKCLVKLSVFAKKQTQGLFVQKSS